MTIAKDSPGWVEPGDYADYTIECDECGALEMYEADGFRDVYAQAKNDGWRAFKKGNEWSHACPDCVADFYRR